MLGWTGSRVLQGSAWGHRVWFGDGIGQDSVCSRRSVGDHFGTGVGQETGAIGDSLEQVRVSVVVHG